MRPIPYAHRYHFTSRGDVHEIDPKETQMRIVPSPDHQYVTFQGVCGVLSVTETDLQRALDALNQPVVPPLKHLDRVRWRTGGYYGVLLVGSAQKHYLRGLNNGLTKNPFVGSFTVVDDSGHGSTYPTQDAVLAVWERLP